jgi:uncharacterized protein involved in outer membrane biogenesis
MDFFSFYSDMGYPGSINGKAEIDINYDFTGYRPCHFLDNSKGSFKFKIDNGYFETTDFQNRFIQYLSGKSIKTSQLASFDFQSVSINISLMNEGYTLQGVTINGDLINLNGFGAFTYRKPLNIPVTAVVRQPEKVINIPLVINGNPLSPRVKLSNDSGRGMCLW